MFSIKTGVKLIGVRPEMAVVDLVVDQVYTKHGIERCQLTSCVDGTHRRQSAHYTGRAKDYGVKKTDTEYYPGDVCQKIVDEIQMRLGNEFDVLYEVNHLSLIHI